MRWRTGWVVLAVLTLVGCSGTPSVGPTLPQPTVPVVAPSELATQKRAAGIQDCPSSDQHATALDSGLPDLVLSCLGGGRNVRLAGLRGHPLMINVWAQWCGPCQDEAPFISEVAAAKTSPVVILGIDYDDPRADQGSDHPGASPCASFSPAGPA